MIENKAPNPLCESSSFNLYGNLNSFVLKNSEGNAVAGRIIYGDNRRKKQYSNICNQNKKNNNKIIPTKKQFSDLIITTDRNLGFKFLNVVPK